MTDEGGLLLVQTLPRNGIGHVGTVARSVSGLIKIGLESGAGFPLAKAVFNLREIW